MASPPPRCVVIDLGGVLLELSTEDLLARLGAHSLDRAAWHHWMLHDPAARAWELGRCNFGTFHHAARTALDLPRLDETQFRAAFGAWVRGPFPGARALVARTRARFGRVACLSNTNALHWARFVEWGVDRWFDDSFASHLIGAGKPDPAAFDHVARALRLPPAALLFLDDNQANVDGARASGWQAARVRGAQEAGAYLARHAT